MNSDLLECKRTAKGLISTVDPPRNATGRKKGYIEVMADLWEEKGYGYLGLKSQNLRDQAAMKLLDNESSSGLLDLSPRGG